MLGDSVAVEDGRTPSPAERTPTALLNVRFGPWSGRHGRTYLVVCDGGRPHPSNPPTSGILALRICAVAVTSPRLLTRRARPIGSCYQMNHDASGDQGAGPITIRGLIGGRAFERTIDPLGCDGNERAGAIFGSALQEMAGRW